MAVQLLGAFFFKLPLILGSFFGISLPEANVYPLRADLTFWEMDKSHFKSSLMNKVEDPFLVK